MRWMLSNRCDRDARVLSDRHYSRQSVGAKNFVPPGRCLVLLSVCKKAYWTTSWPFAMYCKHEWAGAWMCSAFRNEGAGLSSELILEAIAATRFYWEPPPLGMVTFVDTTKVRERPDWVKRKGKPETFGACYRKAGFQECGMTKGGLLALQLLPEAMPAPQRPLDQQIQLFG